MPSERKNITQPVDWWAAYERAAAATGLTLSEWMGKHCNRALTKSEREALSERELRGPKPKA